MRLLARLFSALTLLLLLAAAWLMLAPRPAPLPPVPPLAGPLTGPSIISRSENPPAG